MEKTNQSESMGTIVLDDSEFEDLEQVVYQDEFLRAKSFKQKDLTTTL
jgi:hypothetical protein